MTGKYQFSTKIYGLTCCNHYVCSLYKKAAHYQHLQEVFHRRLHLFSDRKSRFPLFLNRKWKTLKTPYEINSSNSFKNEKIYSGYVIAQVDRLHS